MGNSILLSRNEDLMGAWAKPCLAETQRGAVLDLFPADSLTRIEKKLGLANPAHEFREALAGGVEISPQRGEREGGSIEGQAPLR